MFNNTSVVNELESKKVQMQITKIGGSGISGEEMGGDLNRLEPTRIEDFSKRMVTWFMLRGAGGIYSLHAIYGGV